MIDKKQIFENPMKPVFPRPNTYFVKIAFSENRSKDFSLYEKSRSGKWLPILLGVFASVGSLAVVLFFMNVKER